MQSLIGQSAPNFSIEAVRFDSTKPETIQRDSYSDKWVILIFYPRDFSFVCPTELTAFSARIEDFRSRNCELLGISVDSLDDHRRWFKTPAADGGIGQLQYPLGSDPAGSMATSYGVWLAEQHCSARGLFIIDPDGVIQYYVVQNTSVGRSSDEILRVLDAVQSGGLCPESWTAADGTLDADRQLQPGRVLGHYKIQEKLGTGSFGRVFAAKDLILERRVAIKVLDREFASARSLVLEEGRAAAALNHPNICTVFAIETIDDLPVIVMEYIDGQPLSEVQVSNLSGKERKSIAIGIAEGLQVAHQHGMTHGDLKPANVMVNSTGEAKLLDFGLSSRQDYEGQRPDQIDEQDLEATIVGTLDSPDSDAPFSISGTPQYMSPEQTRGEGSAPESDVYAFGLIVFELFSGHPAIQKTNLFELLESIRSGSVREHALEFVSDELKPILKSTLATDPNNRSTITSVLDQIRKIPDSAFTNRSQDS